MRKRYLLFKIHQKGEPINEKQIAKAIWKNLLSLYGEIATSECRLYINEYDQGTGIGFLQCTAPHLEHVITAASLLGKISETKVSFEPKKTSGTIKALHR